MQYPKTNPWMVSTLILVGIIIGFGLSQFPYLKGLGSQTQVSITSTDREKQKQVQAEPKPTILTAEQISKLPDDDAFLGKSNAPITMVEFNDFQCSFCARFARLTLPSIEEAYIKTGKVKLVYRDFPLDDKHPQASTAALAAECAREQGKFKEMHDMIFNQQPEWSGNPDVGNVMKGYAKKMGFKTKEFDECMDTQKYNGEIRKDLIDGVSVGVNGTPAFFINGKSVSGAMPYDTVFKPIFDAELAGKKWELQYDALGKPSIKVN